MSQLALDLIEKEKKQRTGSLDLGHCGLADLPKQLFELEWLTELIISNSVWDTENQEWITSKNNGPENSLEGALPKDLERLQNLQKLYISEYKINDIRSLENLSELQALYLDNNQISELQSLENLSGLQNLYLNGNQISELQSLENLSGLQSLYLSRNQISGLKSLENLSGLQNLYLSGNKISELKSLENLSGLQTLDLSRNQISELQSLENLSGLQTLYLSGNQISELKSLENLSELQNLYLDGNQISELKSLESLSELQTLYLDNNQISELKSLENLSKLRALDLSNNQINQIHPLIKLQKLIDLGLSENPINDCPAEIWQTNDIKIVQGYFESQTREAKSKNIQKTNTVPEINDVKLIFVGNSGVGKTQLSQYFEKNKLDRKRESTHGIRLQRWLPTGHVSDAFKPLKNNIAVNIWDFGGQEYYHGTFRLFLSNYAVYILLWEQETNINKTLKTEVRDGEKEDLQHYSLQYWLDNIRHYAPDSPILVVQNKIDINEPSRIESGLIDEYRITEDHYISLYQAADAKIPHFKWRFDLFCHQLTNCMQTAVGEEDSLKKPGAWLKIRDAVLELRKRTKTTQHNPFKAFVKDSLSIDIKDFESGCLQIEPDLTTTELYTLPRWLNNAGAVIYFGNNQYLKQKVYLDPVRVTENIYKILNKTVRDKQGEFSSNDLSALKVINKETIIALMQEMEIIFEKPNSLGNYVAPQYLPETHAIEQLYEIAAKGLQQVSYFIRLPLFFYRKVLQRIIFFYGNAENVSARYYWKQGVLFEKEGVRVLFKGIMSTQEGSHADFLIGVELVKDYQKVQAEVFHIICEILENNDLNHVNSRPERESLSQKMAQSSESGQLSKFLHRPVNWTEVYEEKSDSPPKKTPPRWLKKMQVSADGENYVSYLELCNANRKGSTFIPSTSAQDIRIHDLEAILDHTPQRPLKIFLSYSHTDIEMMNRLSVHLSPLRRLNKVELWTDKAIQAGEKWNSVIENNLRSANIILFLLSPDFISSSYIWDKEIPLALQLAKENKAKVISIYIRPFDIEKLEFSDDQMIPKDKDQKLRAISQWENIDEAYMEVAIKIRGVIEG